MDVQQVIVDNYASDTDYLDRLNQAIDKARSAGLPVIYVVVGFRPGFPEASSRNKSFAAIAAGNRFAGPGALDIHPGAGHVEGDIVVTKRRVSAFTGSDLDVVLSAADVDSLVLTGIATSGVVLSTLRQAADLDFRLTVLADACLDADAEVHRVLTEKVFPRQADVVTVADWQPA
jgi:nicotinamidase-related amidase